MALTLVAALAPILALWAVTVLIQPRPFWVHFYDPELAYLGSGLRLLAGEAPLHVDHPGTPLQILSALILLVTGDDPTSVERFRLLGYVTSLTLSIAAGWLLLRTFLADMPSWVAVPAIWSCFVTPQALQYVSVWSPETLAFPFGAVAAVAAWRFFDAPAVRRALQLGLAIGACLALKLTFAGWVPGMFAALVFLADHPFRSRGRWGLGALAGLVLGFVLMTAVVIPRYAQMLAWSQKLASEGYAPSASIETQSAPLLASVAETVRSTKGWALLVVGSALLGLLGASRSPDRRSILVFCLVGIAATFLLAARHGGGVRYLIPAGPLLIPVVAMAGRRLGRFAPILAIAIAALLTKAALLELSSHDQRLRSQTALRMEVDDRLESMCGTDRRVVFGWRLPEPSFALRIMLTDPGFHQRTDRLYPRDGYYDPWRRKVVPPPANHEWDIAVLSDVDAAAFPEPLGEPVSRVGGYGFYSKGTRCASRTSGSAS